MRGLSGFKKQQPQKLMQGGMVRGPGTGTSDSIQAEVPEGSYIMPADSTQAIGAKGLSGLGKPVPVNLSNGEYHLPPEQVHGLGLQVLDQMKAATHTPVSPDEVQRPNGFGLKPQMFFADGGSVGKPKSEARLGLHRQSFSGGGGVWSDERSARIRAELSALNPQ
ncbi:hypothetical protein LX59_03064 [Azomonas agilis]|uniref:Uncharacterized protein n=1 Tax=Azomonas agilis TaxID=116849 RepID=A0A562HZJ1_9GAMM|nr:hypothetical protein [Azomonas agilis]TWH63813.1 hypothetical protein LX59_03064 [Azomonas agilis]